MILTPAHGSFPSGHATEAFIASTVLWSLLGAGTAPHPVYSAATCGEQLMRLASRIAINRTVAGVQFPVDSVAGAVLGLTLARYFVARCTGAASYDAWKVDGAVYPGTTDFQWRLLYDVSTRAQTAAGGYVTAIGTRSFNAGWHSPLLARLWNKAHAEWA